MGFLLWEPIYFLSDGKLLVIENTTYYTTPLEDKKLNQIIEEEMGIENAGKMLGAYGIFTMHLIDRQEMIFWLARVLMGPYLYQIHNAPCSVL